MTIVKWRELQNPLETCMLNSILDRRLALALLLSAAPIATAHTQNNAAAGLSGLAGGAALASGNGQGGSSSQGASGGGGAPIEVQIMSFKGLAAIATDIAALTANRTSELCQTATGDPTPRGTGTSASADAPPSEPATANPPPVQGESTRNASASCQPGAILVEDPASATDLALYQAAQAYSDETIKIHEKLEPCFPQHGSPGADCEYSSTSSQTEEHEHFMSPENAPMEPAETAGQGGGSGGGGSPTGPQWMTNASTLATALGGLKSGITYSPSSTDPTTQQFEVMLENQLKTKGFAPYTATSPLALQTAADELTKTFGKMLAIQSEISNWQSTCKPTGNTGSQGNQNQAANSACNAPWVIADLAAAQQMITGYTTLISTANDGSGNLVLVDISRGKALADVLQNKMPSLQVSVAATGGNTRVNQFFLLDFFWTPPPAFNAGAVVTFELRGPKNDFVAGGARTALFNYKWLDGNKLNRHTFESRIPCGSDQALCAD